MKKQEVILKQKEVLANFYANFALAWFSFGLISPIYSPVKDIVKLFIGIFLALIFGGIFIYLSMVTLKK
ncbi:MAG: hypothetical protein NZM02_01685 [Patescibacteria group bacterium]|nr:hypothetical protein [Patescibacteria group bacterium]